MPPLGMMAGIKSVLGIRSSYTEISDDEASDVSAEYSPAPTKPEKKEANAEKNGKAAKVEEAESLMVESEQDGEDDDDEVGPDEYVVEAITNHMVDEETGELRFEVKWEGYEKKSDRTWEPEENLETASKILNEYLSSVGGKDQILSLWEEKKAEAAQKKGKKRGRASTNTPQNGANGAKRSKKAAPEDIPPASAKQAEFKPPGGNLEDEVVHIDACEGNEGTVVVYLTWKGGHKSQHPLAQVYKRCPQKMLKFYESHLVFKKSDEP